MFTHPLSKRHFIYTNERFLKDSVLTVVTEMLINIDIKISQCCVVIKDHVVISLFFYFVLRHVTRLDSHDDYLFNLLLEVSESSIKYFKVIQTNKSKKKQQNTMRQNPFKNLYPYILNK